jgi:hypothetical protein
LPDLFLFGGLNDLLSGCCLSVHLDQRVGINVLFEDAVAQIQPLPLLPLLPPLVVYGRWTT